MAVSLDVQLADHVVRLRAFNTGDASIIEKASADPGVSRFVSTSRMQHLSEVHAWIEAQKVRRQRGERLDFAIIPVGGLVMIGAIGLSQLSIENERARVGVWITPRARGRGFATAALQVLTSWALTPPVDLARLELPVDADNLSGRNTAERAGYQLEGILRSYRSLGRKRVDTAMYSRLAVEQS